MLGGGRESNFFERWELVLIPSCVHMCAHACPTCTCVHLWVSACLYLVFLTMPVCICVCLCQTSSPACVYVFLGGHACA